MAKSMAINEKLSKKEGMRKMDASIFIELPVYLTYTQPDIVHAAMLFAAPKRTILYIEGIRVSAFSTR